jgi:hypothetical protein
LGMDETDSEFVPPMCPVVDGEVDGGSQHLRGFWKAGRPVGYQGLELVHIDCNRQYLLLETAGMA